MKVVGFNGSPRKKGNTACSLNAVFAELEKAGIETEMINVGKEKIQGCIACYGCVENQDEKCAIKNDPVNEWIQKIKEADGILLVIIAAKGIGAHHLCQIAGAVGEGFDLWTHFVDHDLHAKIGRLPCCF